MDDDLDGEPIGHSLKLGGGCVWQEGGDGRLQHTVMMIVIHIITITIIVIRIRAIMCCICAAIICFRLAFKSASFGGGEFSWVSNDLSDRYLHTGPLS